ncbi:glycoside hydrolase 100 family protein [Candidatus Gracilibacteria bacterium]|nr:glycoside hydrolase 100 family protein [Candidatus Gracilibacteria bacterium]MCF7819256.1 glycoside hydrolase 100 family protein [Candidatus Gracilibacteria bacterium]
MKLFSEGYEKAIQLLQNISTPQGFTASNTDRDNYYRIWGRDGVIIGLATLLTGDKKFQETFRKTLFTLSEHQGEHGEIPSNVDPQGNHVSYGGTAGRVDATLWFVIGCGQYFKRTEDISFLKALWPHIEKCIFLLGAWEFNQKGFLYVPPTGDWSDEYIQQGYVLYDQVLYYQALREYRDIARVMGKKIPRQQSQKIDHLKEQIRANFWICETPKDDPAIYHPVLFEKGQQYCNQKPHWLPFFTPFGYGFRFDVLANVLVSLFDIADEKQRTDVDDCIKSRFDRKTNNLLPAFDPIIQPVDDEWKHLQISFSYTFKNKPYEYHNGGLWPMVTGFYVADLARRGKKEEAEAYARGIDQANKKSTEKGKEWGFAEFLHGKNYTPMGTSHQGWSAGAAVWAHHALDNPKNLFL